LRYSKEERHESVEHTPLQLPPHHPDLNTPENIWTEMKGWFSSRNVSCNIEQVTILTALLNMQGKWAMTVGVMKTVLLKVRNQELQVNG